jgi:hypothetical protein
LVPKAKSGGRWWLVFQGKEEGQETVGLCPLLWGRRKWLPSIGRGMRTVKLLGGDGSRGIGGTGTERGGDWEGNGNSELLKGKCVMNNTGNGRGMEQSNWEIIQTGYNRGNEE